MKSLDEIREQAQQDQRENTVRLQEQYDDLKLIAEQLGERNVANLEAICNVMKEHGECVTACAKARRKLFKAKRAACQAEVDAAESNLAGEILKRMQHDRPDLFRPRGLNRSLAGPSQAPPVRCEARSSNHFYAHIT